MQSANELKQRDIWIDALKGFAILCIIIGHSIERMQTGTGYINAPLHFIDVFVNHMHIYIFFLISGYLYARFDRGRLKETASYTSQYIKKKFMDFMLPYIFFAVLIWIGKMIFSSYVVRQVTIADLLLMLIRPVAFMWFIYILFFICIIVMLTDRVSKYNNKVLLCLSLICVLLYLVFLPEEAILKRIPRNLIVFVFGILIYDHKMFLEKKWPWIISGIASALIAVFCYIYEEKAFVHCLDVIHSIVVPFFCFITFYKLSACIRGGVLSRFGEESLYLYIIHPVAINFVRMVFIRMHIRNIFIWLICLMIAGVGIPYVYSLLAKKWGIFEIWFKPRKYIEAFLKGKKEK